MWDAIVATIASEFSDLRDLGDLMMVLVRVFFALLLAALVGYERERSGSSAGLRTTCSWR
jgi:putative Mg2+ transporter-C (MgtC) family protein